MLTALKVTDQLLTANKAMKGESLNPLYLAQAQVGAGP